MLSYLLGVAGASFFASVGLVAATRTWARRRMVLDLPNDRSLHLRPTPRGGGIGIVVPTCLAVGGVGALLPETRAAATCLAGVGLFVAVVGLVDDVRSLAPVTRLVAHTSAGALVVAGIGAWRIVAVPGAWSLDLGWAAAPVTVLLVVGLTNAYNFMDGVDGIAGVQGVIAGAGWVGVGQVIQDPLVTVTGATIALTSLGLLLFNWSPASIFMGDVGSSFLGFSLASLAVHVAVQSPSSATAGILFVWPFVFDTAFTFLRRASRGENVLTAHRSHLYQRLVLTGVSHRAVALLYGALATVGVAVGLAAAREAASVSIAGTLLVGALAVGLWLWVLSRERAARTSTHAS